MGRIIAVTNQKGGVGKTTTSINFAASMAESGHRVLLVDLDAQGNATMGSGINKNEVIKTGYDLLLGHAEIRDVIMYAPDAGYDLLPGNSDLTAAEVELMDRDNRERRLRSALAYVQRDYDVIIIDCPPSLSMLTINALAAAHGVFIPIQCEYYALEGLSALLETIEQVRIAVNPELEIEGLLRTMYDMRNNLANDVSAQLQQHFGDKVYRTIIPRNVRLAEAPSHGLPVLRYDRSSRGATAYLALAGEYVRRHTTAQPVQETVADDAPAEQPVSHYPTI
ncbi:MAG: ParA family protein [Gammaproteobacteria bacterium]|nr:MAG: ParA family protein [Gammaproteobacteria bacterium]